MWKNRKSYLNGKKHHLRFSKFSGFNLNDADKVTD